MPVSKSELLTRVPVDSCAVQSRLAEFRKAGHTGWSGWLTVAVKSALSLVHWPAQRCCCCCGLQARLQDLQSAESTQAGNAYSCPALANPSHISACRDECDGLLRHFFGPKGDKRLSLETFNQFLEQLHAELVRLEFAHYDHRGQVSFAVEQGAACNRSGSR